MLVRLLPRERLPQAAPWREGLAASEVIAARHFGTNDILPPASAGWRAVARDTAADPMLWFLLITAGLSFTVGQATEGVTLLAALLPLLGMDAYLHRRTLASTAGLASRLASTARVQRDGVWQELPARDLVPGDLVEVLAGSYFPADGVFVDGEGLQADESTLTGESLPVRKEALQRAPAGDAAVAEVHWAAAGTRLLAGTAWVRVVFTGRDTRYGEIAQIASQSGHAATPLQQAIGRLVWALLVIAVLACLALAALRLHQGHGWVDAVMSAVTLAVAALPEEFPVIYTFFLGMGVFRLAQRKALVRRAVAVENIGRTTAIVTDKTGTLTEGVLSVAHWVPADGHDEARLMNVARRAVRDASTDPLDLALHAADAQAASDADVLVAFPFTEARRCEVLVRREADGAQHAYFKGAPETVLARCSLTDAERARWRTQVEQLAASGHKVVAFAGRPLAAAAAHEEPREGYTLAGLVAFEDPVRPGVRDAVAACMAMDMRVLMVTGDHPGTAAAIAREIGLGAGHPRVHSMEEGPLPAGALDRHGRHGVQVVARAAPAQKLELVRALQQAGDIVAVTGDGVNDVPALREADVGIAMGERGTQSAREVAPVVLLDDNFRTIVGAIAEGRQLFQTLRVAFLYLLLIHIPLVMGAAVVPALGMPLLFLPVHVVWLELIIHPTAMLAFQRLANTGTPPRVSSGRQARFFSWSTWAGIVLLGVVAAGFLVWSYVSALGADHDVGHARAMAMALLVLMSAALAAALSGLRSAASRWIALATAGSALALVQWPAASTWLHMRPLHGADWLLALMAAGAVGAGAALLLRRGVGRTRRAGLSDTSPP